VQAKASNVYGIEIGGARYYYQLTRASSFDPLRAGTARDYEVIAVIDAGTMRSVFIERQPGVFEPVTVEAGALVGEEPAVLRGVEAGARVVARGTFLLDSESRLQAALRKTPASPAAPAGHEHGGAR
jgi:hypothetical protein